MADRHVTYALIGGGLAAGNCARWLRESGADGEILLIGRESDLPYNRPDCSKGYLQGKASREDTLFRPADWYSEQQVEALTRVSVKGLDLSERSVELTDGQEVSFDKALLATGAGVRRLSVPGAELEGIHYLRTLGNSDTIREDASGKRVVLIGGSYIATEVAASLTERGSSCSLVMLESVALSRHFGEQAGRFFQSRLEEHGIELHGDDELDHFEGTDGRVTRVVTKSGRTLDADAVVIGVGAVPDVRLARTAGLEIGDLGGVVVDARLQTAVPGVFAAGDIAEYESVVHGGRRLRIEHWDVAFNQGKTAALNMLDRDQPHDVVPYFFSDLSDWASLEYIGPAHEWEQEVVRGSIDDGAFTIFYLHDGRVAGALAVGRSDDLEHARRLLTDGTDVTDRVGDLQDVSSDLGSV
ncbi:MAG TPA: FAD-dependent oxidoreductase [Solirubrobacteraceae bacterium]|nr:FAD-dependent oxidoreductase [Solirubrobacteraceae bacterium]